MIDDRPPPEERLRMWEESVKGCENFSHNGQILYIIAKIGKNPKHLRNPVGEAGQSAKKILTALGWKDDGRVRYFLSSWDSQEQDGTYQLISEQEYKAMLAAENLKEGYPE